MKALSFAVALAAIPVPSAQAPASFKNIKIAPLGQSSAMQPCEPSIVISGKDPNVVVSGVILDRAVYSADGGKTWKDVQLASQFGVFGDPALVSDHDGNFYFFHLATGPGDRWIDRIVCQKSTDGGKSWSDGVGIGHNPPADQDKQWAAVHPTKPNIAVTWTQFDKYGSKDLSHESNIMFSVSEDAGKSFSGAKRINDVSGDCLDGDHTTEGAVPAIGSDGTIYVAWGAHDTIYFDKTKDNGKTWLPHDIAVARQYGGWDMEIPGLNRSNGMPVLMIDNSSGPYKNSLYLVWGDKRRGDNDSDIIFMRSTNGGDTWSKPLIVNQDNSGTHQFLPWMAVDPTSGNIYIVYYDRRAHKDNMTDVMVAYSTNGGQSFHERKISESPFMPTPSQFFGDYNNISANHGVIAPVWARMDNGKTSVWTALIKQKDLIGE